jgi:DNA-binding ferritin-like protein (Dps family)
MTMFISKLIGEKRRWRRYRARVKALPEPYRAAVDAIERYLMSFGRGDGAGWAEQLEDLAALFEQAAVDGTRIRQIVGYDPEEFVEAFVQNYPEGRWITREQERLTNAIARAAGEGPKNDEEALR